MVTSTKYLNYVLEVHEGKQYITEFTCTLSLRQGYISSLHQSWALVLDNSTLKKEITNIIPTAIAKTQRFINVSLQVA